MQAALAHITQHHGEWSLVLPPYKTEERSIRQPVCSRSSLVTRRLPQAIAHVAVHNPQCADATHG